MIVQFEKFKPFIPELLEALRAGTIAEPVPVMLDGSTFAVHGATRTFWVKLWHTATSELTRIERAQVISCLPSTRGVQSSLTITMTSLMSLMKITKKMKSRKR